MNTTRPASDYDRPLVEELRELLKRTQETERARTLSDEDIRDEIEAYRDDERSRRDETPGASS